MSRSSPRTRVRRRSLGRSTKVVALALSGLLALAAPWVSAAVPIDLGTAESFAVLAGSTVTNTGPTVVSGDLGVSPGSAVVGFPPGTVVNGTIHAGDAVAAQAQSDLTAAYNAAAGQPCDVDLTGQDLGGLTLTPGVYCFASSAQLTGTLTLDALGDPAAVFIFQIGTTLVTASNASVNLIGGATACNVFWQVGSSATLGTTTSFVGTIMALTSITANTGATVEGRLLARNGAVTLDSNEITRPICAATPPEASITIVKEADPDSPQNFEFTGGLGTFQLDDDPASPLPRERTFDVAPGAYTVTESALGAGDEPYELESIDCTGGQTRVILAERRVVIDAEDGESITCVFVNAAVIIPPPPPDQASITIVKEAEPNTAQDFEFTGSLGTFVLDDDPVSETPRQRIFTVDPGTYTVTESALGPGDEPYDLESITCTGGQTNIQLVGRRVVIQVVAGDVVSCVFVNTATVPPPPPPPGEASITIVKEAEPDTAQNFTFTGDLDTFVLDDDPLSATPRQRTFVVDPGSYTVTESLVGPDGEPYVLESITCTGGRTNVQLVGRRVVIDVVAGDVVTCVFVNVAEDLPPPPPPPGDASITIVKEAEPDSPQNFVFTGGLGEFILDDDLLSPTPRLRIFAVDAGTYVVTESDLPPGAEPYDLESIVCTGGETVVHLGVRAVVIRVEPGDAVTCVFLNVAPIPPPPPGEATITIVKDTVPDDPQNFEFSGDLGEFILDDDLLSPTSRQRVFTVEPGTYRIVESDRAAARFLLDRIVCSGGDVDIRLEDRTVVITVQAGDSVRCVFVNVAKAGPTPPPTTPPPTTPPPTSPPPGGPGDGDGDGDGLAATGLALAGLLAAGFVMMSTGGGLLYAGRHRPRRRGGKHRPGAARASAAR